MLELKLILSKETLELHSQLLSEWIKNSEKRLIDYKKQLEEVHKDKITFPPDDEFVIWFKSFLRENKNEEQIYLKDLIKEKTYENQGLNPPWCYPEYWKDRDPEFCNRVFFGRKK